MPEHDPHSTPTPGNQVNLDVESRLLFISYDRLRLNLLLSAGSFSFGTTLLWSFLPQLQIAIWCANILLMVGIGLAIDAGYRRSRPTRANLGFWKKVFTCIVWHAGAAWGLGPSLMLAGSDGTQAMLLTAMVLASCAVVVNSVAEQRGAMFGFISLALLPPAAVAWFLGDGAVRAAGIVLLLGHVAFILIGANSHQTLRAMVESQARLNAVLDTSLDAILGVDAEGRFTDWNRRAEMIFGWSRAEIIGLRVDETIIPPRHREAHRKGMAGFLAGGGKGLLQRRIELTALRRDGSEFPIEMVLVPSRNGNSWQFTSFISDISERKATAESLLVLSRAIEQSPASIMITNPEASLLYVNPAFETVTGYSRDEVIGRNPRLLNGGDQTAVDYRAMWETLLARRTWRGEFHNRRKDGSLYWELASISPVVNDAGSVTHYVAVKEDITERKAMEQALDEARQTAEQASRAKSDFLSSMSHELRTPMNAILGFAQILDMDHDLRDDQRDFIGEILKGGTHLLELINDVLEMSRIESGKVRLSIETLEFAEVMEECRTLILPLAAARRLVLSIEPSGPNLVRGDRVRLKQSLLNLLSNAVKYNREGGEIRVRADSVAPNLLISVSDTGDGIAADRMDELFQPFSRLGAERSNIEGTGIGLSITRRLVELMGGSVGAESTPGAGSRFWIELPLADATSMATVITPARKEIGTVPRRIEAGGRHILYVDDNPVNLKVVSHMLENRGDARITMAHTAQLGLELARAEPPDLILLDINMPGMDGYQTLEVLHSDPVLRHIPVIAITANALPRDVERGIAAGFAAYLTKPLNHARLVATIDEFLPLEPKA